jgi:aldose 1-epimerase
VPVFSIDNGRVRVSVLDYGATVVGVQVPDRSGGRADIAVRLPALRDYREASDRAYVGSTMGRFARIVPNGRATIDGRPHVLTPNAGPHHIHGGPDGFDNRVWTALEGAGQGSRRIVLGLTSPDGDQGYPGTLTATATYELDDRDRLTVRYEATADRPTLCGLSTHVFWNLTGYAPGAEAAGGHPAGIGGHVLQLNAARVLESGADFVPTGQIADVAGTDADLRAPRLLGDLALDRFFPVPADPVPADPARAWVARLYDPVSGRRLTVGTDQSGMAVYTGDHLPGRKRAGICLQPGPWPYLSGQPGFPSPVLLPGQAYRSTTIFAFDEAEHIDATSCLPGGRLPRDE